MKVKVDLALVEDTEFIIASAPTGVVYSNQCGGCSCAHPEFEGYLVVLADYGSYSRSMDKLFKEVEGHWSHRGEEYIKKILREAIGKFDSKNFSELEELSFDEEYEGPMGEAWIPVRFKLNQGYIHAQKIIQGRGILTYFNSD